MRSNLVRFCRRAERVRRKISLLSMRRSSIGKPVRLRLSIFRSNKHFYAQVIDDSKSVTLVSASTLDLDRGGRLYCSNSEMASSVGELIGSRAAEAGVSHVVLDRGGNSYSKVLKAFSDAARKTLVF